MPPSAVHVQAASAGRAPRPLLPTLLLVLAATLPARAHVLRADPAAAEVAALRRLLADPSPSARAAAARRLSGRVEAPAIALLLEVLDDPHPYVRRAAAGVLGVVPDPDVRARLAREGPRLKSEAARRELCAAYAVWLDGPGRQALLESLGDRAASVRVEALRWLAEDGDPAVQERVRARVTDPDPWVRAEALDAARGGGATGGLPFAGLNLTPALIDPDPRVRLSALEAAVQRGGDASAQAVVRALKDVSWSVRLVAAQSAGQVRDRSVLEALVPALQDVRTRVVEAAGRSLVRLTGIPFDPSAAVWGAWLSGDGASFDPAQVEAAARPPRPELPPGTRTVSGPRFLDLPLASRHLAFVLDGSGSMAETLPGGGTRWGEVGAELTRALAALTGATVNLCVFADDVAAAFPRAGVLGAQRREALLAFVRGRAPRGHTALYDGIAWALADPEIDSVVVLSDGAPSAGTWFTKTDLLAEVRRANRWRRARIDVIAVGADQVARRWRDALETIAQESGGTCIKR